VGGDRLLARSAVELLLWLPTPLPCNGCASAGADGVGARGNSACAAHWAPVVNHRRPAVRQDFGPHDSGLPPLLVHQGRRGERWQSPQRCATLKTTCLCEWRLRDGAAASAQRRSPRRFCAYAGLVWALPGMTTIQSMAKDNSQPPTEAGNVHYLSDLS